MKKRLQGLIAGTLIGALVTGGAAFATVATKQADLYYRDIKIVVDGSEVTPTDANGNSTEPFIIEGTTYLPVRALANALGMEVSWDEETSTVIVSGDKADGVANVGTKLFEEFSALAQEGSSAAEIAQTLAASDTVKPINMVTQEITAGHLAGFGDSEITGFEKGTQFSPMIGTIAFVGYVFELSEDADVDAFIAQLEKEANLNWNICTSADDMVVGKQGNKVFFVMCPSVIEE